MQKAKKIELAMPTFFIILGIGTIKGSYSMSGVEGTFPKMVGSFMVIVAAFILITAIRSQTCNVNFEGARIWKVSQTVLALFVYAAVMKYAGYILSTIVLSTYTMHSLGYKNLKRTILYSVVATLLAFILFKILLRVPLPLLFLDF